MTTDTAVLPAMTVAEPAPIRRPRRLLRRLGIDTGYTLTGFPLAIAAFVVVVTGLAAGAGLLVVWVGVAVLAATLLAARGFATVERAWLPAVLDRPVPHPAYLVAEGRPVRKLLTPLRDPQTWLDALHALVRFPLATVSFVVTVTTWSLALGGLTYGAWDWALPDAAQDTENTDLLELLELLGFETSAGRRIALNTAIGVVFALLLPFVVRAVALLQAQLGRVMLTSRAAAQAEIGRLAEGREAAVAAEAVALRRLERDIHDGPQQRLVRLAMDLARAQRQLDTDPARARATLGEATDLARETLEELRALSRGIAPPVLADRGLAAALAALAARSPVPVDLSVDLPTERLAPVTENTAYFVVSEALANVAKHSDATLCRVALVCAAGRLRVVVEDDGAGGAVLAPGHGLAGLTDRLHAVDGQLTVDSPRGGPTRLTAELPCT
ncbi:sensor domain-containing protein [Blastococcus sp. TML/M2B]|uniref:sensor histidine kinase n=1 Tax=unclassified Blastococcus TaxID=2619396 RepID=UPI00190C6E9E|nr:MULTISPECIES: sensor histidine kinase [unclassified Blastococcus]MBN1092037.1 sensor domain-containing protein [Blastococcus sp. TML/M2B]MBN1097858.1 sensor domain-containing protein [Blastococcus sp. TML/C7B]